MVFSLIYCVLVCGCAGVFVCPFVLHAVRFFLLGRKFHYYLLSVFFSLILSAGGCGRFFEGTAEQMYAALIKTIAALPDDTLMYLFPFMPCLFDYCQLKLIRTFVLDVSWVRICTFI